jgi:hypothetical protein
MKFFLIYFIFLSSFLLKAEDYELGHGIKINEHLHIGSYFSTDYSSSDEKKEFRLDDVAILAYGNLSPDFSYLMEFESAPTYSQNFTNDTIFNDPKLHYERMFIDYIYSNMFNIRFGKQISPIGYWNLEPINVLRDTSSNPIYASVIFPKLFTGLDLFGYFDEDDTVKYHLFVQNNKDLDEDYINIKNEHFVGASLAYEFSDEIDFGASVGEYITSIENKRVKFIESNVRYDSYPFLLQAEIAYSDVNNQTTDKRDNNLAGYAQGMYSLNMKHALISRYEYIDNGELGKSNSIGIFGYSYRPVYSVSLKAEYQWNSDAYKSKSIISFSVLF